jgi:hypothetical protein
MFPAGEIEHVRCNNPGCGNFGKRFFVEGIRVKLIEVEEGTCPKK